MPKPSGKLYSQLEMERFIQRGFKLVGSGNYVAGTMLNGLDYMARTKDGYPFERMISHKFRLEAVGEAFKQVIGGEVTRAGIVPD